MSDQPKIGVSVGVMVLNEEGLVLLGQRNPDPEKASSALSGQGTWTMPGGKVCFGESLEEAAARELFEETGIHTHPSTLKLISLAQDMSLSAHFITCGLLLENSSDQPKVIEETIISWQWFDLNKLPSPLFFPSERIISNYSARTIYNPTQKIGKHK